MTAQRPKKSKSWVHITECENQISRFFNDNESRIFVLKGPFGSGKSHFIRHTILTDPDFKKHFRLSAHVSLFGLQNLIGLEDSVIGSLKIGGKGLDAKTIDKGLKLIKDSLGPLVAESSLSLSAKSLFWTMASNLQFLLILDDIDRKGDALKIEEILGFVSSLTEMSDGKTKAILVVNEDEIGKRDRRKWDSLREKFIDFEFAFNPPPQELAEKYLQSVELATEIGVIHEAFESPNIRVMKKIESHVKNISRFLAGRGIEIGDPERAHAARLTSLYLGAGKDYKVEDLDFGHLNGIKRYYATVSGRPDLKLEKRRQNLDSRMRKIAFTPDPDWDPILLEFLVSGTVSDSNFELFRNSLRGSEEQARIRAFEKRVHFLLFGTFRDTSQELESFITENIKTFPNTFSIEDIINHTKLLESLGRKTAGIWRIWILARRENFSTSTVRKLEAIIPKSLIKLLPKVTRIQPKQVDPMDLLLYHSDRGSSVDFETYIPQLAKWSVGKWVSWLTHLSEEDESRLSGFPSLLREIIHDKVRGGERAAIAKTIESALCELASKSKINKIRVSRSFPSLNSDES